MKSKVIPTTANFTSGIIATTTGSSLKRLWTLMTCLSKSISQFLWLSPLSFLSIKTCLVSVSKLSKTPTFGTLVSVDWTALKKINHISSEVQAFAVWEKDAKDESGFVGYCYLDLFPRSQLIFFCAQSPLITCSRQQVFPCRSLGSPARL